jgi:hypothetical protein
MKELLLILTSVFASPLMQGDFNVTGSVACKDLQSSQLQSAGAVEVTGVFTSASFQATTIEADTVKAKLVKPPSGTLTIEGNVSIGSGSSSSFLQLEWGLAYAEDFEKGAKGWSSQERSACNDDFFLGGLCKLSSEEVSLAVDLQPHSRVRVKANFHMLDAWMGQSGYLTVDDKVVWSRPGLFGKLDVCGGSSPDAALSLAIDVTIPHTSRSVSLKFGSTLSEDACEASYGVDDVELYVQ